MISTVRKCVQTHTFDYVNPPTNYPKSEHREKHPELQILTVVFGARRGLSTILKFFIPKLENTDDQHAAVTLKVTLKSRHGRVLIDRRDYPDCTLGVAIVEGRMIQLSEYHLHGEVVTVEFDLEVKTEMRRKKNWDFGGPVEHLTDTVLVAEQQKFHVHRVPLALQSAYFNTIFFGQFRESGQSEIELKDIDAKTLQCLLEIVYHRPNIDAFNVESLLEAGRMYDFKIVTDLCQKFLDNDEDMKRDEKWRIADEYGFDELKRRLEAEAVNEKLEKENNCLEK